MERRGLGRRHDGAVPVIGRQGTGWPTHPLPGLGTRYCASAASATSLSFTNGVPPASSAPWRLSATHGNSLGDASDTSTDEHSVPIVNMFVMLPNLVDFEMTGSMTLAARAAYILRDNSTGVITKASPSLYPHQWSWDAGFNAIGLAVVDLPRARRELDALFAGSGATAWCHTSSSTRSPPGTGPAPSSGSARGTASRHPSSRRPAGSLTRRCTPSPLRESWRSRPPMAAEITRRPCSGRPASTQGRSPGTGSSPASALTGTGLMTLFHGWESGTDNSPAGTFPTAT